MKSPSRLIPWARRGRPDDLPAVIGSARLDHRTKDLTKRVCPGDIAIIDHRDLDRVSADALINCHVAAVVNVAPSITGRYPNLGPQRLIEAGIPLVAQRTTGIGKKQDYARQAVVKIRAEGREAPPVLTFADQADPGRLIAGTE